jgi:hypothetical protein
MKKILSMSLMSLIPLLLTATASQAQPPNLVCQSPDGTETLKVQNVAVVPFVVLNADTPEVVKFAIQSTHEAGNGVLYGETTYDLVDGQDQPATLSVVSRVPMGRGGCGRAGCDAGPGKIITAELKYHDLQAYFSCKPFHF